MDVSGMEKVWGSVIMASVAAVITLEAVAITIQRAAAQAVRISEIEVTKAPIIDRSGSSIGGTAELGVRVRVTESANDAALQGVKVFAYLDGREILSVDTDEDGNAYFDMAIDITPDVIGKHSLRFYIWNNSNMGFEFGIYVLRARLGAWDSECSAWLECPLFVKDIPVEVFPSTGLHRLDIQWIHIVPAGWTYRLVHRMGTGPWGGNAMWINPSITLLRGSEQWETVFAGGELHGDGNRYLLGKEVAVEWAY